MTLVDILKNSVEKHREHPALIMRPRYRTLLWTYRDLWRYAEGAAEILREFNVKAGEPVLLWAANSPYWVGAFFGILLRGGVVVPLHTENTPEFIKKVALETEARVMLKSSSLRFIPENIRAIDIDLQSFDSLPTTGDSLQPLKEDNLAEIVYTSGTTGDPKGVMLTHKNIISNIEGLARAIPMDQCDRLLSILPLSHMFEQVAGMLFPLFSGARIIYIPRIASGLIIKALREHRVTKLLAVPQFLDTVMKKIEARAREEGRGRLLAGARRSAEFLPFSFRRGIFHKIHKRFGGKLRTVASGGAPLDPALEKKWELLGIKLLQGYGLTETSPVVSVNTYKECRFGSIGKPLQGVSVKIADDGELLVKGPNIFHGYFKDEDKTQKSFTSDGWFMTGDMGGFDHDGFLYIRGRKKYMILGPGGQNVYPEDIEFELNKQPGVRDSAVVGFEAASAIQIYAVLLLEQEARTEHIIEEANKNLASFQKIQAYSIWPFPDFPRSATRKVQKEKVLVWLRGQKQEALVSGQAVTPLTRLLAELFGRDPVTLGPGLLLVRDLGLDSILRIELVTRIEEVFGMVLEESLIDAKTTIRDLESLVERPTKGEKKRPRAARWSFVRLRHLIRTIIFWAVIRPLLYIFVRTKVSGVEVFDKTYGPVVLMPNHRSYLDSLVVLAALPRKVRTRIMFAIASDMLRYFWWLKPLLLLFAFSFPRHEYENIEVGLEVAGDLVDRGFSIALYPEGRMSESGKLLSLKRGAGLLAIEMSIPVIPVFIDGSQEILPYAKIIPKRRGRVRILFGEPLQFAKTESYIAATEKIQRALTELSVKA